MVQAQITLGQCSRSRSSGSLTALQPMFGRSLQCPEGDMKLESLRVEDETYHDRGKVCKELSIRSCVCVVEALEKLLEP